jgi:hypothetical protein
MEIFKDNRHYNFIFIFLNANERNFIAKKTCVPHNGKNQGKTLQFYKLGLTLFANP